MLLKHFCVFWSYALEFVEVILFGCGHDAHIPFLISLEMILRRTLGQLPRTAQTPLAAILAICRLPMRPGGGDMGRTDLRWDRESRPSTSSSCARAIN